MPADPFLKPLRLGFLNQLYHSLNSWQTSFLLSPRSRLVPRIHFGLMFVAMPMKTAENTGAVWSLLKSALDAALNFVYPPVCQLCGQERAGAREDYVGGQCWRAVRFVTAPYCDRCGLPYDGKVLHPFRCANCAEVEFGFRFARSAVKANAMMLDVIHRYKYHHALWFEPFLTDLLERTAKPDLGLAGAGAAASAENAATTV